MRLLAVLVLVACSAPERARSARVDTPPAPRTPLPAAPGLRLPDGVTPLHYELKLVLDPERETFTGEVKIRVRVERATDHVWIHAHELVIKSARFTGLSGGGALTPLPVEGDQMMAFGFGRTVQPGELELAIAYTGKTTGDQEGLFRQQAGGRWYLFSQGESVFARRITPCFDEPRFKTPWRVTLDVPRRLEVFANTPEQKTELPDSVRKLVTFETTPPMPSYLLALALGPFDVEQLEPIGKNRIPVRVAVRAGAGKQVLVVERALLAIADAMEDYIGEPLPLKKLDLVAVPQFFGAMENPGLVTFQQSIFIGKDTKQRRAYFSFIAAHELAHQWFGNSVTPAWWDDLWLSESFASWLGDKIAREVGALDDRPLHGVLERRDALEADSAPTAVPLRRPISGNTDPEDAFDAIAYQKGQAVLASFEALVGAETFRTAIRDYLRAGRDRTTTTADVVAALTRATSADLGKAFEQYATLAGVPVVDLTLRCTGKPAVIASARDQRLVPACIRYAGGKAPVCALVGDKTELAVGTTCPAWIDPNPNAAYYYVYWRDRPATQWLAKLEPPSRVMIGDDVAAAVQRGELPAKTVLAELRALLTSTDPHAHLAAYPVARALDALVDDKTRAVWSTWLARHLPRAPARKAARGVEADAIRHLGSLFPTELARPELVAEARKQVDKILTSDAMAPEELLRFGAVKDGDALFDRLVDRARATKDKQKQAESLQMLGAFPPRYAGRTAMLAVDKPELGIELVWRALAVYFARPDARTAAWRALRTNLDTFKRAMPEQVGELVDAAAQLCDQTSRDEVATAFAGHPRLEPALTAIDTCVARRAALGDLAAAIATSR